MATKIIITRKSDNVITNIVNTQKVVENGLLVTDDIIGEYIIGFIAECDVFPDIETPDTVKPQEYKYTVVGGFVKNPDYVKYVSIEEEVEMLKAKNTALETELLNTKLATAEMVEQQQTDKLENQLALAEIIEVVTGGGETV